MLQGRAAFTNGKEIQELFCGCCFPLFHPKSDMHYDQNHFSFSLLTHSFHSSYSLRIILFVFFFFCISSYESIRLVTLFFFFFLFCVCVCPSLLFFRFLFFSFFFPHLPFIYCMVYVLLPIMQCQRPIAIQRVCYRVAFAIQSGEFFIFVNRF